MPPIVCPQGLAYNPESKAKVFVKSLEDSFTDNPEAFDNDFIEEVNIETNNYLANEIDTVLHLTTPGEIMNIILKLDNRKAPGPDSIKNIALKALPLNAITNLTKTINKCLIYKYFPIAWKTANITVLPKPGKDESKAENYRPISLLSSVGKIFEKILLERIKAFCNENNIIPDFQHGFRENTSTLHQLLRVNNQIIHGFSQRMITGGVFHDVQKAFDRIWHKGLIYKLIKRNFPPYLIHIINSFLNNRAFRVKIDHFISQNGSLKSGCPQGSLLSPILFNIFTSDFPTHPEASIHLFADDAAILVTEKTESEVRSGLQYYLHILQKWLTKWRIAINTNKSQAIMFRCVTPSIPNDPLLLFNGTIAWTTKVKYLGLTLDHNLRYKSHLHELKTNYWKKYFTLINNLGKKSKLSLQNKILIYKVYLRPSLLYGCQIWANMARDKIIQIQRIQNMSIRGIVGIPRYIPVSVIHEELKIEPVGTFISHLHHNFHSTIGNHNNPTISSQEEYKHTTHRFPVNATFHNLPIS
ncbi:RNA-directed DNA polymerase from mobile element jockey [Trichonephila clavipes]|nr:RNA-directed DNA polymerase from mobile element jockey [Trichonephila clavipes]